MGRLGRGTDQVRCKSRACRKLVDIAKAPWKFEKRSTGVWLIIYCNYCKNAIREDKKVDDD